MKALNKKAGFLMLASLIMTGTQALAQLSPLGAMYYQNQYVNNPAYAGLDKGLRLDLGVKIQDSKLPGAPKTQFLTGAYALTDRAGFGLNINAEQIGLIKQIRTVATYAYHLPLNANDDKISFGLSLGFTDQMIDFNSLNGSANDASIGNFNQRQTYIDGDFGILYRRKGFSLEAALPNISNFFRDKENVSTVANLARYYAAASYQFSLPGASGITLEPKLAYRSVQGFKDIFDFGTNIKFVDQKLSLFGLYHSTQSATVGVGAKVTDNLAMNFMYTSATAVLAGESSGSYEVNLRLNLFGPKKATKLSN